MRALLLAALVVLAGCTAAPPGGTDSPTASTTPVPTPTGPCEVDDRPSADVEAGDYDGEAYPERPESLTEATVGDFVASFEERYIHNGALAHRENVTYLETYVNDVDVTSHGDVYVVRLTSYTNGGFWDTEKETPIEIHWDGAPQPVTYLVTEDRLLRSDGERSPAALRNASTVACV